VKRTSASATARSILRNVAFGIVLLVSMAAQGADFVLGPEAMGQASQLREAMEEVLGTTFDAPRVDAAGVTLRVQGSAATFRFVAPGLEGIRTVHGALRLPDTFERSEISTLVQRLDQLPDPLEWRKEGPGGQPERYDVDSIRADKLRQARQDAIAIRRGDRVGSGSNLQGVDSRFAFTQWLRGDESRANTLLNAKERKNWERIKEALESFPRSDPGIFGARESIRGAPKLWAYAALAALAQGNRSRALAYADVATRFALVDADALKVWQRLTGQQPTMTEATGPSLGLAGPAEAPGFLPYALLVAGLLGWVWCLRGQSKRRVLFGLCAGLCAVASFLGANHGVVSESNEHTSPSLPSSLQAPLAGGGCIADPPLWAPHGYTIFATCDEAQIAFEISSVGSATVSVEALGSRVGPTASGARQHLKEVFQRAMADGWKLTSRPVDGAPMVRRHIEFTAADQVEYALTAALACLTFFMLFVVGRGMWLLLAVRMRLDPRLGRWILALFVLVVVAHAAVDARMVMVYTGYDLTSRLTELDSLPRYGAGSVWVYKPAFLLFGVGHESVQVFNRIAGILLFFPVLTLVLVFHPRARLEAVFSAALVGLMPVFLRDHSSEGIQAGTCFILAMGMAGTALALRRRGDAWLGWASLPILVFVGTCRPEAAVALPCLVLGMGMSRRACLRADRRKWALYAIVALAWFLPHVQWLMGVTEGLVEARDISPVDALSMERVARVLMQDNIFLRTTWVPWVVPALAFFALRFRSQRALIVGYLVAGLLWIAMSSVDLPDVSIPRVHLPALLFVVPLAGVGLTLLRGSRPLALGLVAITAVWCVATASSALAPTNGDAEEALVQRLMVEVNEAEGKGCVARFDPSDAPTPGRTPRYFPDYAFPGVQLMSLEDIQIAHPACQGRAWVILGTRCYMQDPELGELDASSVPLKSCEQVREKFSLEPIVEEEVSHRPESTLPMYPPLERLHVGLYRVVGRR
jgi:hypothetical protein